VNRINATTPTSYDGGDQYLVDDTNPVVRAAIFDKFWEGYGTYGIKTIWIDAAEAEGLDSSQPNTWLYSAGTGPEVGEAWVQTHARTFAEGFATKGIAPTDYFILPRSAWAGSWRYSAALWSGDIESTFEELALQVRVLQGVMMSGPALWTTDVSVWGRPTPACAPFFQPSHAHTLHSIHTHTHAQQPLLFAPPLHPLKHRLGATATATPPTQSSRT
jgi:hypothetical protein